MMTTVAVFTLYLISSAGLQDQKTISADPGQDVTLTCRATNNNFILLQWSRADLESDYVFVHRDGHFVTEEQHPSFKDRVELQDRQMKDGDMSLILKDVTTDDEGTYECRVNTEENSSPELISIIYLRVSAPPGQRGGTSEDGGKKDGVSKGRPGLAAALSVFCVFCVVVVAFVISGKLKKKNLPPSNSS